VPVGLKGSQKSSFKKLPVPAKNRGVPNIPNTVSNMFHIQFQISSKYSSKFSSKFSSKYRRVLGNVLTF
jgi:hypothetical protein